MLKNFQFYFATRERAWALDVFLAFRSRHWWWRVYSILWREGFFRAEWSAGHCCWIFLPAKPQGVYFSFFQRMSLHLRLTKALVDLFILILVIPWEPEEAEAVPFGGQGAWCYFSHALCTAITQSFSNSALTQMWSSKADANRYTNSILVALSCSGRFIASHNPINHTKRLEFLKFKDKISAVVLAEPEDLVSQTAGARFSSSLSPSSGGQLPLPWGCITTGRICKVFQTEEMPHPAPLCPA